MKLKLIGSTVVGLVLMSLVVWYGPVIAGWMGMRENLYSPRSQQVNIEKFHNLCQQVRSYEIKIKRYRNQMEQENANVDYLRTVLNSKLSARSDAAGEYNSAANSETIGRFRAEGLPETIRLSFPEGSNLTQCQ